jgi:hypothetical protein
VEWWGSGNVGCLMASWSFRCRPDIDELLLPAHLRDETGE